MNLDMKCSVDGCDSAIYVKGYCRRHYQQCRKYGNVKKRVLLDPNEIVVKNNYAEIVLYNRDSIEISRTIIDKEYINKIKNHKWYLTAAGYVECKNRKEKLILHRFIMNASGGFVVDHINHNKLDNRKCNLRICTHQQNSCNSIRKVNNTGKMYGVRKHSKYGWEAYININKKKKHLGLFKKKSEAAEARLKAELEYYGEYAYINKMVDYIKAY